MCNILPILIFIHMKKTTETKEREFFNLKIEKIQFDPGQDYGDRNLKVDPGVYLGEFDDGSLCLFVVDKYDNRNGVPLDSKLTSDLYTEMATQKAIIDFKEYMEGWRNNLQYIADTADFIFKEFENAALKDNAQTIAQSLVNIEKQIKELPKQTENQKSSLTEMGEVVVNIIKATK